MIRLLVCLFVLSPVIVWGQSDTDDAPETTTATPVLEVITDRSLLGNYPLRPIFRWQEVQGALQYQLKLNGRTIYAGQNTRFRPGYDLPENEELEAWVVAIVEVSPDTAEPESDSENEGDENES